jgi:transcriptional regulator with XRE-family HTH domain
MTQNVTQSNTIGAKIKLARTEAGLSTNRLAVELAVDPRTVARWQSNEVTPSIERILRIAAVTNQPAEFFFSELAA